MKNEQHKREYCKDFRDTITLLISLVILPVLGAVAVAKVWEKFGHLATSVIALLIISGYLWLIDVMSEDD
nr:MAG TPA: hypothetical protein [Caudoviricetes sp.]